MRNFTEHLAIIRSLLSEATVVNFTDTEILNFSNDVIKDISSLGLKLEKGTITQVAAQVEYAVPTGCLDIDTVIVGTAEYMPFTDWAAFNDSTNNKQYYLYNGKIVFNQDPTTNATIFYKIAYTAFTLTTVSDIPENLDPLAIDGTMVRCFEKLILLVARNREQYPDAAVANIKEIAKEWGEKYNKAKEGYKSNRFETATPIKRSHFFGPVIKK